MIVKATFRTRCGCTRTEIINQTPAFYSLPLSPPVLPDIRTALIIEKRTFELRDRRATRSVGVYEADYFEVIV